MKTRKILMAGLAIAAAAFVPASLPATAQVQPNAPAFGPGSSTSLYVFQKKCMYWFTRPDG